MRFLVKGNARDPILGLKLGEGVLEEMLPASQEIATQIFYRRANARYFEGKGFLGTNRSRK